VFYLSRWLWKDKDVQQDLVLLKQGYTMLGYVLTLEQTYDSWYMYSESCSANWLNVSGNIRNSLWCVEKVLSKI
jgi:hypothetical protein